MSHTVYFTASELFIVPLDIFQSIVNKGETGFDLLLKTYVTNGISTISMFFFNIK